VGGTESWGEMAVLRDVPLGSGGSMGRSTEMTDHVSRSASTSSRTPSVSHILSALTGRSIVVAVAVVVIVAVTGPAGGDTSSPRATLQGYFGGGSAASQAKRSRLSVNLV